MSLVKEKFLKIKSLLVFCAIAFVPGVYGQCPDAAFTVAGAVCVGQPVSFTNSSTGVSYGWDFCSGDFDSLASLSNVDSLNISNVTGPNGATPVIDGTVHCAFICSRNNASIVRV